jgi:phosphonate transport system permease protein
LLAVATLYGFLTFDYKNVDFIKAVGLTASNVQTMFTQARISHFTVMEAFNQVFITLGLAFLTTLMGAVVSLFLGLLAARNLSNIHVSNFIRGVVAFIRAVPTVLWVLIFAVSAGLGSVAAIIGLSFHGIGYLVKAYSEAFEEIDEGVIEALKASGATWWQIVFQAVLPSSASYLMAWTFMRFEINFTVAVAMGAAAGAGGIGFALFMAGGFYFDIREVGFITYMILFFALTLEIVSTRLKHKYLA